MSSDHVWLEAAVKGLHAQGHTVAVGERFLATRRTADTLIAKGWAHEVDAMVSAHAPIDEPPVQTAPASTVTATDFDLEDDPELAEPDFDD